MTSVCVRFLQCEQCVCVLSDVSVRFVNCGVYVVNFVCLCEMCAMYSVCMVSGVNLGKVCTQ